MSERHVAGAVTVDLVKLVKTFERAQGEIPEMHAEVRALLGRRVGFSEWISLALYHKLLEVVDGIALFGKERRALNMGMAGGAAMRGVLKAYGVHGDPVNTVLAMRHAWSAHYDFGRLRAEAVGERAVRFTVQDYPDNPMPHALMTAGWGVAAARSAGADDAHAEVLDRPWLDASEFIYVIRF